MEEYTGHVHLPAKTKDVGEKGFNSVCPKVPCLQGGIQGRLQRVDPLDTKVVA